ncbi:hypothetical protein STENM223S_00073 [Streptomyces tendae]
MRGPRISASAPISAIRSSHAGIDARITTTQQVFPVIQDRGFMAAQNHQGRRGSDAECASARGLLPVPGRPAGRVGRPRVTATGR